MSEKYELPPPESAELAELQEFLGILERQRENRKILLEELIEALKRDYLRRDKVLVSNKNKLPPEELQRRRENIAEMLSANIEAQERDHSRREIILSKKIHAVRSQIQK